MWFGETHHTSTRHVDWQITSLDSKNKLATISTESRTYHCVLCSEVRDCTVYWSEIFPL
jgi:hypothetical protein